MKLSIPIRPHDVLLIWQALLAGKSIIFILFAYRGFHSHGGTPKWMVRWSLKIPWTTGWWLGVPPLMENPKSMSHSHLAIYRRVAENVRAFCPLIPSHTWGYDPQTHQILAYIPYCTVFSWLYPHICLLLDFTVMWYTSLSPCGLGLIGGFVQPWTGGERKTYNETTNDVLLVKIEGSVWYTIYHPSPVKGVNKPLYSSTNQLEFGTSMEETHTHTTYHYMLYLIL